MCVCVWGHYVLNRCRHTVKDVWEICLTGGPDVNEIKLQSEYGLLTLFLLQLQTTTSVTSTSTKTIKLIDCFNYYIITTPEATTHNVENNIRIVFVNPQTVKTDKLLEVAFTNCKTLNFSWFTITQLLIFLTTGKRKNSFFT